MMARHRFTWVTLAAICAPLLAAPAWAQDDGIVTVQDNGTDDVLISMDVAPQAYLDVDPAPNDTLALTIPPADSTPSNAGVDFDVLGNANACVTAQPDEYIDITNLGQTLGKATNGNGDEIGYDFTLRFPNNGGVGPNDGLDGSPGDVVGPLCFLFGPVFDNRPGQVLLHANPDWTNQGSISMPGVYVGSIVLTVTVP
jgi:hypothetical protein